MEVSCAENKKDPGLWKSYVPAWFGTICTIYMVVLIDFSATFDGKLELNEVSFEPIARERESGGPTQQGRWIRKFHPRVVSSQSPLTRYRLIYGMLRGMDAGANLFKPLQRSMVLSPKHI